MVGSNAKIGFRPCIRITCTDHAGNITILNITSYKSHMQQQTITKALAHAPSKLWTTTRAHLITAQVPRALKHWINA